MGSRYKPFGNLLHRKTARLVFALPEAHLLHGRLQTSVSSLQNCYTCLVQHYVVRLWRASCSASRPTRRTDQWDRRLHSARSLIRRTACGARREQPIFRSRRQPPFLASMRKRALCTMTARYRTFLPAPCATHIADWDSWSRGTVCFSWNSRRAPAEERSRSSWARGRLRPIVQRAPAACRHRPTNEHPDSTPPVPHGNWRPPISMG